MTFLPGDATRPKDSTAEQLRQLLYAMDWLPSKALPFRGIIRPRASTGGIGGSIVDGAWETFKLASFIPGTMLNGLVDNFVAIVHFFIAMPVAMSSGEWVWKETNNLASGPLGDLAATAVPLLALFAIVSTVALVIASVFSGSLGKAKNALSKVVGTIAILLLASTSLSSAKQATVTFPSPGWMARTGSEVVSKVSGFVSAAALKEPPVAYGGNATMSCTSLRTALYTKTNNTVSLPVAQEAQVKALLFSISNAEYQTATVPLASSVYGAWAPKVDCLKAIWERQPDALVLDFIREVWGIKEGSGQGTTGALEGEDFLTLRGDDQTRGMIAFVACEAPSFADYAQGRVNPSFEGLSVKKGKVITAGDCQEFFKTLRLEKDGGPFDLTADNLGKAMRSITTSNANSKRDAGKFLTGVVDPDPINYFATSTVTAVGRVAGLYPLAWIALGLSVSSLMVIFTFGVFIFYLLATAYDRKHWKTMKTAILKTLSIPLAAIIFLIVYFAFVQLLIGIAGGIVSPVLMPIMNQLAIVACYFIPFRVLKKVFKSLGIDPTSVRSVVSAGSQALPDSAKKALKEVATGGKVGQFAKQQVKQAVNIAKSEALRTGLGDKTRQAVQGLMNRGKVQTGDEAMDLNGDGEVRKEEADYGKAMGLQDKQEFDQFTSSDYALVRAGKEAAKVPLADRTPEQLKAYAAYTKTFEGEHAPSKVGFGVRESEYNKVYASAKDKLGDRYHDAVQDKIVASHFNKAPAGAFEALRAKSGVSADAESKIAERLMAESPGMDADTAERSAREQIMKKVLTPEVLNTINGTDDSQQIMHSMNDEIVERLQAEAHLTDTMRLDLKAMSATERDEAIAQQAAATREQNLATIKANTQKAGLERFGGTTKDVNKALHQMDRIDMAGKRSKWEQARLDTVAGWKVPDKRSRM
jgi:hypothetical protein